MADKQTFEFGVLVGVETAARIREGDTGALKEIARRASNELRRRGWKCLPAGEPLRVLIAIGPAPGGIEIGELAQTEGEG